MTTEGFGFLLMSVPVISFLWSNIVDKFVSFPTIPKLNYKISASADEGRRSQVSEFLTLRSTPVGTSKKNSAYMSLMGRRGGSPQILFFVAKNSIQNFKTVAKSLLGEK